MAALTRGGYAQADIDRLMTATGANIVAELKKHPEQLGILGSVLDARILHMDMLTVLALARDFGSDSLHAHMKANSMSVVADASAPERLRSSELGLIQRHAIAWAWAAQEARTSILASTPERQFAALGAGRGERLP